MKRTVVLCSLGLGILGLLGSCAEPETEEAAQIARHTNALSSANPGDGAGGDTGAPDVKPGVPSASDAACNKAEPKDTLISELVKDSWRVKYPLTALAVDAAGNITGSDPPPEIVADLEIINTVPEARDSVARALRKVSGLPPYGMLEMGPDVAACEGVQAWTPTGPALVPTSAFWVHTDGTNEDSWRVAHREFGKECPLVKTIGNRDIVDPPGDGSTNLPPSTTVSATGVRANPYGLCASGTPSGTHCKLSYAAGINWIGRKCGYYYGSLRCLVQ